MNICAMVDAGDPEDLGVVLRVVRGGGRCVRLISDVIGIAMSSAGDGARTTCAPTAVVPSTSITKYTVQFSYHRPIKEYIAGFGITTVTLDDRS